MISPNAGFFLSNYVYQIPIFIVWIIAAVVAVARWQRHPRPSLLLLIALGLFFLRALVGPIVTFTVVHSDIARANIGMVQGIISFASTLVAALAWILLLAAALGWRDGE